MHVTRETPAQIDRRLRTVASTMNLELLDGDWWYEEFPADRFQARVRSDAVALVRDEDGWCQLVPVRDGDRPPERALRRLTSWSR